MNSRPIFYCAFTVALGVSGWIANSFVDKIWSNAYMLAWSFLLMWFVSVFFLEMRPLTRLLVTLCISTISYMLSAMLVIYIVFNGNRNLVHPIAFFVFVTSTIVLHEIYFLVMRKVQNKMKL